MINEYLPIPKDSNTPEITIPKVEIIKANEKILNPITPILINESVALNHDKINLGKRTKIRAPLHNIIETMIKETLIIVLTRSKY